MDDISKEDIAFLDDFLEDELTEEGLKKLDLKLKNPQFKIYYQRRLDEKYNVSFLQLFTSYLPMIIFLMLTFIGVYLILTKI